MKIKRLHIIIVYLLCSLILPSVAFPTLASAKQKVIKLRLSHAASEMASISKMVKKFGDRITQRSGGRIKISYYWGSTLVPYEESFKGVQTGLADIGNHSISVDTQPLTNTAIMLPFLGYQSMESGTKIFWELFNSTPAIQEEWSGVKLLVARMMPPLQVHNAKKAVRVPSDIKGTKVGSKGEVATFIQKAGGIAIDVQIPDLVMSLTTGLIEGWWSHFPSLVAFKTMELLPYHTILGEGGMSMNLDTLIMNEDTWNKLPSDIKKIFEEEAAWYTEEMIRVDSELIEEATALAKSMNHEVIYLTPDEIKLWHEAAIPVHQQYLDKIESKNKPAHAIYNRVKQLIETSH